MGEIKKAGLRILLINNLKHGRFMFTNLYGIFELDKSNLINQNLHLVIGTRKHPTPTKPKHYILQKIGNRFKYISSIYLKPGSGEETSQIYEFDYEGCKYTLNLKTGLNKAEIIPCKEVAASNPQVYQ